jgi:hypothetical protein
VTESLRPAEDLLRVVISFLENTTLFGISPFAFVIFRNWGIPVRDPPSLNPPSGSRGPIFWWLQKGWGKISKPLSQNGRIAFPLIIQELGKSNIQMWLLEVGDGIENVAEPLGQPTEIENQRCLHDLGHRTA